MTKSAAIIGAGVAGIATAIRLALKGYNITIFESNSYPGGKLTTFSINGYRFDAGPSLFTMPHMVEELLILAGQDPASFPCYKLDVCAHYFYNDGTFVRGFSDPVKLTKELEKALGEPASNVQRAVQSSANLYRLLGDLFINAP